MHNIHFILVKAPSAHEAAAFASETIADWGDSNNWRSIGGIASEDGTDDVENLEDADWGLSFLEDEAGVPKQGNYFSRTIAYIRALITDPVQLSGLSGSHGTINDAIAAVCNRMRAFDEASDDSHTLWQMGRNLNHLYELANARKALSQGGELAEFYAWQLDETGFTDMTQAADGQKRYIIFLDMHS